MNKNKIILFIAVIIFALFLVLLFKTLGSDSSDNTNNTTGSSGGFNIWTYGDDTTGLTSLLSSFKETYPQYQSLVFNVSNFSDYQTYNLALASAISKNKAPDVFVMNNNENSIFSDQVIAIPNTIVNPSDFRKKYKAVFGEDLIITFEDESEYVTAIPIGYELLGIYYDRKFVKSTQLTSQASLSSLVSEITQKDEEKIGIALGNGSTVYNSSDIITQYFMLSGADELEDLDEKTVKTALETYFRYGSDGSDNGYNSDVFLELTTTGQNNLDLFSRGDVAMVVGYPRMLSSIAEKGYSKKFLLASPFPHYAGESGKTLVNYNSFVINKNSLQTTAAYELMAYMTSDQAVELYLEAYPYYLPASLSLESAALSNKIDDSFNITLGDFYNGEYELSSFNKAIKSQYDSQVTQILDDSPNYKILFENFKNRLICQSNKIQSLENLSVNCM